MNTRKEPKLTVSCGDHVRDRISGFEGIVTSITDFIAGCRRIAVNSRELKDGKPLESEAFDEPDLEIIEKNVIKPSKSSQEKLSIKLGDRVRDEVTTFEGIATSITRCMSNSPYIGITPEKLHDGKPVQAHSVPSANVKKIKEQKHQEPKKQPTGGNQAIPKRPSF